MRSIALIVATVLFFSAVGCASLITYVANLTGPNEFPPNASPGTGFATVVFDDVAHTLEVSVTFQDLVSPTTASHIHCCTAAPETGVAGVATQLPRFVGFPTGVTSGVYDHMFDTLDSATWNPAFITAHGGSPAGAEAFLAAGLAADEAYLNIHTDLFPAGEIRGFLHLQPVPEPATMTLMAGGLVGLMAKRRRALK